MRTYSFPQDIFIDTLLISDNNIKMHAHKHTVRTEYLASFVLRFCALTLIGFGIFGAIIFFALNRQIGQTYTESFSTLSRLQAYLPRILTITAIIQTLTLCLTAMLLALLWSQKIAGPLFRVKKYLKDIAAGKELKEFMTFRANDQLPGIAGAFSEMILTHKYNNARALCLLFEAQKILIEYETLLQQGKSDSPRLNAKLKELKEIYSKINGVFLTAKHN